MFDHFHDCYIILVNKYFLKTMNHGSIAMKNIRLKMIASLFNWWSKLIVSIPNDLTRYTQYIVYAELEAAITRCLYAVVWCFT